MASLSRDSSLHAAVSSGLPAGTNSKPGGGVFLVVIYVVVSAVVTLARKIRIIPEIRASFSCLYSQQAQSMSDVWLFLVELVWQQSLRAQAP